LIVVGDPGLGEHNAGDNSNRIAETKRAELAAQGFSVIVTRASSDQQFADALTNNGPLSGVEYVGHASFDVLYIGEQAGAETNLEMGEVGMLSNRNLTPDAYIKINACFAGSGGDNSIAASIGRQLQRSTLAFDGGTVYSGSETRRVTERDRRGNEIAPARGPLYLIGDRGTALRTFPYPR
jgi:hypothetical protein